MTTCLKDKVILITGASRGIGREMALRFAKDGAKIVVAAKSTQPHETLPGTIFTVAKEVEENGGQALPLAVDVRDEDQVKTAIDQTIATFGGLDVLINNASALNLDDITHISMKRFDLIFAVNVRATFLCAKYAIPHLKKAENPHVLTLSPPLNLDPKWFKKHLAYTMSKYGMSMCTLGLAESLKPDGIGVNSLWPKTLIATAAVSVNLSKLLYHASRKPAIMADAAYEVVTTNSRTLTGQFLIDEAVLRERGVTDFNQYAMHRFVPLAPDIFID